MRRLLLASLLFLLALLGLRLGAWAASESPALLGQGQGIPAASLELAALPSLAPLPSAEAAGERSEAPPEQDLPAEPHTSPLEGLPAARRPLQDPERLRALPLPLAVCAARPRGPPPSFL